MTRNRPVRAVLLDVDGTLYHQDVLRFFMAVELAMLPLVKRSYRSAAGVWKIVRTFRHVREELRRLGASAGSLAELQYVQTAYHARVNPTTVEKIVAEWIFQRPLKYLRLCRRHGVEGFFQFLGGRQVPIGIFSDYPVWDKLKALGLSDGIGPTLCATDPDINAFKPHPRGFLQACEIWGLAPDEILYVGDRPQVDAAGAAAAGMSCAVLSMSAWAQPAHNFKNCFAVSSFRELQRVLSYTIKA